MVLGHSQKDTLRDMVEFIDEVKTRYPGVYEQIKNENGMDKIAGDAEDLASSVIPMYHLNDAQKQEINRKFVDVMADTHSAEELADMELAQRVCLEEMIDIITDFKTLHELQDELGFDIETGEVVNEGEEEAAHV